MLLEHPVAPAVTVVKRVADEIASAIQQAEIDAPGVDSDAVRFACVVTDRGGNSLLDFGKEAQRVPVDAVPQADGSVWKPVNVLESEAVAVESSQDGPPTLSAQIENETVPGSCHT